MKISCCMIVKNEENILKSTLDSAKGLFDELVVVDTGSTDNTVKIAKSYTDKVYNFKWMNDFSHARNYSIAKAQNDLIFILDADEAIVEFNLGQLESLKINENHTIRVKRRNYLDNGQVYLERIKRLFDRRSCRYEGIIHEQVLPFNRSLEKVADADIVLDHVGYMNEVLKRTEKIDRNITMLMEAVKNDPEDPYLHFQLGKSYSLKKQLPDAKGSFETALKLIDDYYYEYAVDLIISYGYTLVNLQQYAEALKIEKYHSLLNNQADYLFLLGLVYMNNADFSRAVELFMECLKCREGYIEGVNTFLPCYNIGIIFECLGYKKEAIDWLELCKDYPPAIGRLKELG